MGLPNLPSWWSRVLRLAESGLRPGDGRCLWCSAELRGGGDARLSYLCAGCAAGVPWIERIECSVCGRAVVCPDCPRRANSYIVASRSAVQYTPFMKEMLARYKYRGSEKLAPMFGEMAGYAYVGLRGVWGTTPSRSAPGIVRRFARGRGADVRVVLTYVPLSERRLEERGFNQAEMLARAVGQRFRVPVLPSLVRLRHTEKQSYKTRRERLESLERAFAPCAEAEGMAELRRLRGSGLLRIVVADDVYTTGSTLQRCGEALTDALGNERVEVYGLTWAR